MLASRVSRITTARGWHGAELPLCSSGQGRARDVAARGESAMPSVDDVKLEMLDVGGPLLDVRYGL